MRNQVITPERKNHFLAGFGFACLILLTVLSLASGNLQAQDKDEEILKKVEDETIGNLAPADIEAEMIMVIKGAGGEEKRRELLIWTKNNPGRDAWRLMKFLTPADIKDLGLLVLGEEQMYLYMPEFERIRRIASHNKKESFVGSDFSYDDLGTSGFSAFFVPAFKGEDEKSWQLELKRKPEAKKQYSKIIMTVDKVSGLPVRLELYDDAGELFKIETQENTRVGKYWIPTKFTMENVKAKTATTLELKNVKVDQKLSPEIFTERNLKRSVSR